MSAWSWCSSDFKKKTVIIAVIGGVRYIAAYAVNQYVSEEQFRLAGAAPHFFYCFPVEYYFAGHSPVKTSMAGPVI